MNQNHHAHEEKHAAHAQPYLMFGINMALGLAVMYAVMFTMIDEWRDFRNNLNMLYMAITMWAPMGIFMLITMPGMFSDRKLNIALHAVFLLLTAGSFLATREQAAIGDHAFIASMVPHHSGAILMCREANLSDAELLSLCMEISQAQREEIEQMNQIARRLD